MVIKGAVATFHENYDGIWVTAHLRRTENSQTDHDARYADIADGWLTGKPTRCNLGRQADILET